VYDAWQSGKPGTREHVCCWHVIHTAVFLRRHSAKYPCTPVSLLSLSHTHTYTHTFNGSLSRTTQVNQYQKGKTSLDFTEARDSEWHWHQLGRMQVCTSLQTDNHASTPPLSFLQAGRPSCCPTNSIRALKAVLLLSFSGMYTALISECAVCIWNILLT